MFIVLYALSRPNEVEKLFVEWVKNGLYFQNTLFVGPYMVNSIITEGAKMF